MKALQLWMVILIWGMLGKAFALPFLEDRQRGWYWFEELKPENLSEKKDKNPTSQLNANQVMEKLQASIQSALNLAILSPTEAHIQDYLKLQIRAFKLAQRFTETAKFLQVSTPALDYQLQAPYHSHANLLKNQQERQVAEGACWQLAQTHGLFFFFDSRCPYCVLMSPNVLRFAQKYKFPIIAVSTDGGNLREFPHAVLDNGISNAYGVTHLPALFAVNPKTNEVLKLANRVESQTELEETVLRHQERNTGEEIDGN